jgi:hypothetical protein
MYIKKYNYYFDGCPFVKKITIAESLKSFAKTKAYHNAPEKIKMYKIKND